MCGEEPSSMLPEPWPDAFAIRMWELQTVESRTREESKIPLCMVWRQRVDAWQDFEQKHQPVCVALITVFAHQAREMEVLGLQIQSGFLVRLATRTNIG